MKWVHTVVQLMIYSVGFSINAHHYSVKVFAYLFYMLVKLFIVSYNGRIETRRNNFKIVFKTEKHDSVKELSKRLVGYDYCTRFFLVKINYNLVSSQTSSVGDNFDSHEEELIYLERIYINIIINDLHSLQKVVVIKYG